MQRKQQILHGEAAEHTPDVQNLGLQPLLCPTDSPGNVSSAPHQTQDTGTPSGGKSAAKREEQHV